MINAQMTNEQARDFLRDRFKEAMKDLLEFGGFTMDELAERVDVNYQTLYRLRTDEKRVANWVLGERMLALHRDNLATINKMKLEKMRELSECFMSEQETSDAAGAIEAGNVARS